MTATHSVIFKRVVLILGAALLIGVIGRSFFQYRYEIRNFLFASSATQNKAASGTPLASPSGAMPTPTAVTGARPEEQEDKEVDWDTVLDLLAGHPDDPQLPKDTLGASDAVLAATNPNDVADILRNEQAIAFARSRSKEPRFLFSLGRAAVTHGYQRFGQSLLEEASGKGSAAATAYLGYLAEEAGDKEKAGRLIAKAIAAGFDSQAARQALSKIGTGTADLYDVRKFRRAEFIKAFMARDFTLLKKNDWMSMAYAAAIHETLWAGGDILFMTTPKVLLELDPEVGSQVRYKMGASASIVGQQVGTSLEVTVKAIASFFDALNGASDPISGFVNAKADSTREAGKLQVMLQTIRFQGEADARRLAIGFEGNEDAFRKIYSGLQAYVLTQ